MKTSVSVPKSLKDMPLGMFGEIRKIIQDESIQTESKVLQVVAIASRTPISKVSQMNWKGLAKIYSYLIDILMSYKEQKLEKEIEVDGRMYVFFEKAENWNAANFIDIKVNAHRFDNEPHIAAALCYVEKGMTYGQEENGRTINPLTARAEIFKDHFSTQDYFNMNAFFLRKLSERIPASLVEQSLEIAETIKRAESLIQEERREHGST